jgi:hypothetical protein
MIMQCYQCHISCILFQTQKTNSCMSGWCFKTMYQLHPLISPFPQFPGSMKKKIHLVIGVLEMVGCCCIACYLTWHLHVQIKQECWCGRSLGEWDLATHVFLTKISRKPQQVSSYRPCWFSSFVSARTLWASGDTHMWMLAMCFY